MLTNKKLSNKEVEQQGSWATRKLSNKKLSNKEVEQQGSWAISSSPTGSWATRSWATRSWATRKLSNKEVHQQEVEQQEVEQLLLNFLLLNFLVAQLLVAQLLVAQLPCCSTSLLLNFLLLNFLLLNFPVGELLVAQLHCCSTSCCSTCLLLNLLLVNFGECKMRRCPSQRIRWQARIFQVHKAQSMKATSSKFSQININVTLLLPKGWLHNEFAVSAFFQKNILFDFTALVSQETTLNWGHSCSYVFFLSLFFFGYLYQILL